MLRRISAVVLLLGALLTAGCSSGDDRPTLADHKSPTSVIPSTTLPSYIHEVAEVLGEKIPVYDAPDAATPTRSFPNPWLLNDDPKLPIQQVFLVTKHDGQWLQILLPERPNGSTGWVRASDVRLTQNRYRIAVELGAHRITVYDGDSVLLQEPVAIGTNDTPTPPGTYYLRVLLKAPNPNTVYGPYAYGLSAHSDVLDSFNGGDGEIGIHGNNDASVLGQSVTHGCIRMSNDGITRLAGILPLGTPVEVTA